MKSKIQFLMLIIIFVVFADDLLYSNKLIKSEIDFAYYDTTKNALQVILTKDLSQLWLTNFQKYTVGYIGDNYQRFYIRFLKVKKDKNDSEKYYVSGKTRVKSNICDYSGTIIIKGAFLTKISEFPSITQGVLIGEYNFNENSNQVGSGNLSGVFLSYWAKDSLGNIFYDSLSVVADGYSNNLFSGKWIGFKNKQTKPCNWGDFRIPFSEELDIGTGEFCPADLWLKNGWETYYKAFSLADTVAQKIEEEEWWK